MTFRFRPHLDQFEAREVPAALSFQLPDGSIGSGLFSAPDGVDAAQSSQVLPLTDLTVTKGGVNYTVQPGASAHYAYGELVGVGATATGPDTIQLNSGTVISGGYAAPINYDEADTEVTFSLPDGTTGAISFDIPWDQVNLTQASQTVSPLRFNLNIAGQNVSDGFTSGPTLTFEYGEFVGLNFMADTSALAGFPFTSIAANGLNVTAIQAGTGQPLFALAQKTAGKPTGFINFAPLGTQANAYVLNVKFTADDGSTFEQSYNIGANTSAADVTTLVMDSIPKASVIPGGPGEPPTYVAGWYVKPNAAGTGFFIYTHRAQTEQKWGLPKPVSVYKSATVSAVGVPEASQPTVSETQSGPK